MPVPLASTGDHVPPVWGVPPRYVNKSTEGLVLHKFAVPLVPVIGCGFRAIVTLAVALGQGAIPVTV
jgi:hypothetical protein